MVFTYYLWLPVKDIHKSLEEKIARFHGCEDAILYISCFDANAGLFEVLMSVEDAVISDELNHASIIDGIRLCKAQRLRYKHLDMEGIYDFSTFNVSQVSLDTSIVRSHVK